MSVAIREMTIDDYFDVIALWHDAPVVDVTEADTRDGVDKFLSCNPGLRIVAIDGESVVGTILCGHDGSRGYLSHLAVAESHRRRGLGSSLLRRAMAKLDKLHMVDLVCDPRTESFYSQFGMKPAHAMAVRRYERQSGAG
ncbi:MAG: GNAT family N-acetyltransferase [Candidatus Eisenbacteria bacterium]